MAVDFQEFQTEVLERLTELRGDVKTIKSNLAEDYKILHGNGRPGLVYRVTVLENNWRWIRWIAGAIGGIIGFFVSMIVTRFF